MEGEAQVAPPGSCHGGPMGAPGPSPNRALSAGPREPRRAPGAGPGTEGSVGGPLGQSPGWGSLGAAGTAERAFALSICGEHRAQSEKSEQGREGLGGLCSTSGPARREEPGQGGSRGSAGREPAAPPGLLLARQELALPAWRLGQPGPQPDQRPPEKLAAHFSPSCLILCWGDPLRGLRVR